MQQSDIVRLLAGNDKGKIAEVDFVGEDLIRVRVPISYGRSYNVLPEDLEPITDETQLSKIRGLLRKEGQALADLGDVWTLLEKI